MFLTVYNVCGSIGTVCLTLLLTPQVVLTYRTKNVEGLSVGFLALNYLASAMMLVYGFGFPLADGFPILVSNSVMLVNNSALAVMRYAYRKPRVPPATR